MRAPVARIEGGDDGRTEPELGGALGAERGENVVETVQALRRPFRDGALEFEVDWFDLRHGSFFAFNLDAAFAFLLLLLRCDFAGVGFIICYS